MDPSHRENVVEKGRFGEFGQGGASRSHEGTGGHYVWISEHSIVSPFFLHSRDRLTITGFLPSETIAIFEQLVSLPQHRLVKLKSLSLEFWTAVGEFPCVRIGDNSLVPFLPRLELESLSLQGADLSLFEFPPGFRLELKRLYWENSELEEGAMKLLNSAKDSLESLVFRFDNYSASTLFSDRTTFASLHSLPHLTYLLLHDIMDDSLPIPSSNTASAVESGTKESNENLSKRFGELFRACSALKWLKIGITPRSGLKSTTEIDFHLELLSPTVVHLEFGPSDLVISPSESSIIRWLAGGGGTGLRTLLLPGGRDLTDLCLARGVDLAL